MLRRISRSGQLIATSGIALMAVSGCFSNRDTLPATVLVELPDGTTVEAEQGSGAPSLADSKWQFFRTSTTAQGLAFVTILFGPEGNLQSFENNTIASGIFGSTILFDGERHNTSQAALQYSASTYGAQTANGDGFSFEGRLSAFAAGIPAGYATASATGTFDPVDPDTMTGTFTYSTRVTLPIEIPNANQDEKFTFVAHRVVEE